MENNNLYVSLSKLLQYRQTRNGEVYLPFSEFEEYYKILKSGIDLGILSGDDIGTFGRILINAKVFVQDYDEELYDKYRIYKKDLNDFVINVYCVRAANEYSNIKKRLNELMNTSDVLSFKNYIKYYNDLKIAKVLSYDGFDYLKCANCLYNSQVTFDSSSTDDYLKYCKLQSELALTMNQFKQKVLTKKINNK